MVCRGDAWEEYRSTGTDWVCFADGSCYFCCFVLQRASNT